MKAVLRSRGEIIFSEEYQKPVCSSKNLLIRVKAASINPLDYKAGWPILGSVVGFDFAGVVEEKGANVKEDFNVGDEVYGAKSGTLAEFIVVDPARIALKPKTLSFVEAAALPVAYLTSLQGLRDYGKIEEGNRVLIIGASGGCGTAAVQLAKVMGAKDIVGVCSGKNAELVRSLGATDVVDYTKQTVKEFCSNGDGNVEEEMKFDIVYDAATSSGGGEDYKDSSMELLKSKGDRHGQYVAINGDIWMWLRLFTIGFKPNQHLFLLYPGTGDLEYLSNLVDYNGVKPVIAEDLPFDAENVDRGFALLKSRRAVGTIVFHMDN